MLLFIRPMTRLAMAGSDPVVFGLGRSLLAAAVAAVILLVLYPVWLLVVGLWFLFLPRDLRASVVKAFDLKGSNRSEEHTSELQSLMRITYAVFCFQKKKHDKTLD